MAQTTAKKSNLTRLFSNGDILLVVGLFGTVLLMILPIHPFFLDGFLAISIALSLLILLSILYVKEPAEFTGFPTLLPSIWNCTVPVSPLPPENSTGSS